MPFQLYYSSISDRMYAENNEGKQLLETVSVLKAATLRGRGSKYKQTFKPMDAPCADVAIKYKPVASKHCF